MKKISVLFLLALLSLGSAFGQAKKKTSSSGNDYVLTDFRGIRWGEHIDSIVRDDVKLKFIKSKEVPDKNVYVLENDELVIGTVLLDKIYYVFNKNGRFTGVVLIGKRELGDRRQFGEMKYILTYKFGNPEIREVPGALQYYWMVDDVRITLDDQEPQGIFSVEFFSDYERSESKRVNMNVSDF